MLSMNTKDSNPCLPSIHDASYPPEVPNVGADETSSLMSKSTVSLHDEVEDGGAKVGKAAHDPHRLDIRGLAMLPRPEFWQLFTLLGLLTGVGLMTIK